MRTYWVGGLVTCVMLGVPMSVSAQDVGEVEGTYTFRVTLADGQTVVAEGQLVLSEAELDVAGIDETVVALARDRSRWLLQDEARVRVCFGFEDSQRHVGDREFYGGIIPVGLSDWEEADGEVRIHVYQSPDASQYLTGAMTETGLEGRVLQRDWDASSTGAPVEWLRFEAERISEPSPESCERILRFVGERRAGPADPR